jgi:tetratricopeptide (TPR) repeat protein
VLREKTVTIQGDLTDAEQKFAELADSLLVPAPTEAAAASGIFGTHMIAAWQAYDSGHAALARWDLDEAERRFRAALAYDPQYGLAHLWLAQTASWRGVDPESWRDEVRSGLEATAPLVARDRAWGSALLSLAEGRYQDACRQYDAMIQHDSLDFRAWYGRGECRRLDHVVLKDPRSPSGWGFGASYHAAIADYQKALTLVPSVHRAFRGAAFDRLSGLFYAEPNVFRWGTAAAPDTTRFGAFPALRGDTLGKARGEIVPDGPASPLRSNLARLRQITGQWVVAFPTSPDAWESRARVLEATGELEGGTGDTSAALPALRQAVRLSTIRKDSLRLRTGEVQLLVKLGHFGAARSLADSTLGAFGAPTPPEADEIAGLAALTGRASRLSGLLRLAATLPQSAVGDPAPNNTPPALRASLAALLAFASLGGPADSALRQLRTVDDQIRAYLPQASRAAFRLEALEVPLSLLHPSEAAGLALPAASPREYLLRFQSYLRRGDTSAVRSGLDTVAGLRRYVRPSDVSLDKVYQESVLYAAIGDSAAAVLHLDQVLNSLAATGSSLVRQPAQAGALIRAMMLRARLAASWRDESTARRWAGAAAVLWAGADPGLQASVDTMRRIAAGGL